jgi:hypothetical protein
MLVDLTPENVDGVDGVGVPRTVPKDHRQEGTAEGVTAFCEWAASQKQKLCFIFQSRFCNHNFPITRFQLPID